MALRISILLYLFLSNLLALYTQDGVSFKLIESKDTTENIVPPRYEGGNDTLYKYLTDNIKYPLLLVDIEMEGDIQTKIRIGENGEIKNINILRGFDPLADERVERAVRRMPKWLPGTIDGKAIETDVELLVSFTLTDSLRNFVKEQKEKGISLNDIDTLIEDSHPQKEKVETESPKLFSDTLENRLPEFPGGKEALDSYIKENIKYPKRAIKEKIEGKVIFLLTVSTEGEITKIVLRKGLGYECNDEAFYLIKRMPKWIPGLKNGKPTTMDVLLPIPFVLPK